MQHLQNKKMRIKSPVNTYTKRAIMQSSMISLMVVAIVIFIVILGSARFFHTLSHFGTSNACRIDGLIDTATYTAKEVSFMDRLVQNSNFQSSCPVNTYYVKFSEFKKLSPIEAERIKTKELYNDIEIVSDKQKAEYNAEKFVGEQLVDCYNRYDGLTIFPPTFTVTEMDKTGDTSFFGYLKGAVRWVIGSSSVTLESVYAPPTFCSVCSKLYFDEEYQTQFSLDENFLSAERYLRATQSMRQKDYTLYELIDKGRYKIPQGDVDVLERYIFAPEASPYAVVYYRRYDYKMTGGDFVVASAKLVHPVGLIITGISTGLRVASETALYQENKAFIEKQRELRVKDIVVQVKKDEKLTVTEKIIDRGLTTGIASLFNQAHNTYGLYRWFTPILDADYKIPDEYGVAIIPYADAIVQCDFVAHKYGSVRVAKI
jgi:hypothetical protein